MGEGGAVRLSNSEFVKLCKYLPVSPSYDLPSQARSSGVEHCYYLAEVGGSNPTRAYQFSLRLNPKIAAGP